MRRPAEIAVAVGSSDDGRDVIVQVYHHEPERVMLLYSGRHAYTAGQTAQLAHHATWPTEPFTQESARIEFHLSADTTWYPGRGEGGLGILCFNAGPARTEIHAPTWRDAIDKAIEFVARGHKP